MNYEETILVFLNLSSSWQSIRPSYLPNIHHHNNDEFKVLILASKKYRWGKAETTSIVKATEVLSLMQSVGLFTTEPLETPFPFLTPI